MISHSPYRRIAVASAFSPRLEQVLSEAKRIRDRFGAELSLIYVGEKTADTVNRFGLVLQRTDLPGDSAIYYEEGEPVSGILRAIEANSVELIVAGALEKEVVLHPFLGNVARRLLREAPSSVMLFTRPERAPKPLRRIVFVAEYSEHGAAALRRAVHLAAREKSDRLYVVRLITTFDEARAAINGDPPANAGNDEAKLEQFVLALGATEVPMEVRFLRGNTGFIVADFVKSIEADLLVVPVEPGANGGQLPPHLTWLADVIPCNLWLVR